MNTKEQYLADKLKCPNCGSTKFAETHINAAMGFRCDCGLEFNFMPLLRQVDITRDPSPEVYHAELHAAAIEEVDPSSAVVIAAQREQVKRVESSYEADMKKLRAKVRDCYILLAIGFLCCAALIIKLVVEYLKHNQ